MLQDGVFSSQPVTLMRVLYGGEVLTWNDYLYRKDISGASSRPKRKKPALLYPQYGTPESVTLRAAQTTQIGAIENGSSEPYRDIVVFGGEPTLYKTLGQAEDLLSIIETRAMLANQVRESIYSQKSQLAVDLAELGKTKAMLADAGRDLLHFYRNIRAGRTLKEFDKFMRNPKKGIGQELSKRWLEYIYGWAPTVAGIYETAEVLNEELKAGSVITGSCRVRKQFVCSTINELNRSSELSCKVTGKAMYQFTIADPKLLRFSQLGFTNPLSIAWELTPWSFVFDWFVDVGGYINRMDFALGITDVYYQTSIRRTASAISTEFRNTDPWGRRIIKPVRGNYSSVYRERSAPLTNPSNTFKGFKAFTNETVRLTTSVALITQQLSALRR